MRFFFDIADGWLSRDTHGSEFADVAAARAYGLKLAAEVLRGWSASFEKLQEWSFIIRDDQGHAVFRLTITGETMLA